MGSAIIIIIVTLLFSAFFSGMEIAFTSSNRFKLEIDRKQKGVFGPLANIFVNNPGQYLTTMLVGNNIVLVVYSLNMTLLIHHLASQWGLPLGSDTGSVILETLVSTLIIIFAGEFIPKSIVKLKPNAWLKWLAIPVYMFYLILYPAAKLITWLALGLFRMFGFRLSEGDPVKSFEKIDLENLLEENITETQAREENEIKIFQNALDFSDLLARDCMVPRVEVEAIDAESTIALLTERFIRSQFSRIFVWEGSIDNIIGYVNIKSLFRGPSSVRQVMRKVNYVPETMPAERLLEEFTKNKRSVAVVIDEFGGTAGIISLEDILEEIFGEIDDEHDTPDTIEKVTTDGAYIFSSRLEVEYLNGKYNLGIAESDEYDTLGGFLIFHEDDIPSTGTVIEHEGKSFTILKSTSSRIELVKVKKMNRSNH